MGMIPMKDRPKFIEIVMANDEDSITKFGAEMHAAIVGDGGDDGCVDDLD
jgi:hypothetical protein